jgi:hypothetical protein
MRTGTLFLDHLADLLAACAAPGTGAASGGDVADGLGPVGDDGANGSITDAATDADDHFLEFESYFQFQSKASTIYNLLR